MVAIETFHLDWGQYQPAKNGECLSCAWIASEPHSPPLREGECLFTRSTPETVAYPRLSKDVLRFGRIGLDLLPKVSDEDTQVVGLITVVWSPHGLEKFSMRHRFARVRNQVTQ